jgi:demethylmenaquinone methyltransferase / 2-methoxy-6-polyprenyl-1,4-benzoquinol methylase
LLFASVQIRDMFDQVAPRYDLANQILSLGVHHQWRKRLVRAAGASSAMRVLDCATGTGDLAFAFKRAVGETGSVTGLDFAPKMITLARNKPSINKHPVDFMIGDILALPFANDSFDMASIAFGIRNVDDPIAGMKEMARVVRTGGRVAILEFGQPDGKLFAKLYRWYSDRVIPTIGGWITDAPASYRYLADSSASFPAGDRFVELMNGTDAFSSITVTPLSFKIAYMYLGTVR